MRDCSRCARLLRVQLHQDPQDAALHACSGGWRHGSALGSVGLGCTAGSFGAGVRKSSVKCPQRQLIDELPETVAEIPIVHYFVAAVVCFIHTDLCLRSTMACITRSDTFKKSREFTARVLDLDDPRRYVRLFL